MNLGSAKNIESMRKKIEIAAARPIQRPEPFRTVNLLHFALPKRSIEELAHLCGLVYKDGKVG
jgi:hypothetical protein